MPALASSSEALLELALSALRRVGRLETTAHLVGAATDRITAAKGRPLTAAIVGADPGARTSFLNFLAGDSLLDPRHRRTGAPVLTLCRGERTTCRIHRRDGSVEELLESGGEAAAEPEAAEPAGHDEARTRAREAVAAREMALVRADAALPWWMRQRPPRWAFWLWIARFAGTFLWRRQLAERARAEAEVGVARRALAAASQAVPAPPSARPATDLPRLIEAAVSKSGVARISLELARARLPEGVVAIDLPEVNAAGRLALEIDGCVYVGDPESSPVTGLPRAVQADLSRLLVIDADDGVRLSAGADRWLPVGDVHGAVDRLPALLAHERALRLGRRALEAIRAACDELDDRLERAEASFAARIDDWDAVRLRDPETFIQASLDAVRPAVNERVHQLIGEASVQLSGELGRLEDGWLRAILEAGSGEELRVVATRIEEEGLEALGGVQTDIRRLIEAGLRGGAHEIYPRLVEPLRQRAGGAARLPPAERSAPPAPAPAPVDIAPALADGEGLQLGAAASRLRSLFRSLEGRKERLRQALTQRLGWIRGLASAELLDAEPALAEALLQPLGAALTIAVSQHQAWVESELAAERAAIARERAALEPTARLRQRARDDEARLARSIAEGRG